MRDYTLSCSPRENAATMPDLSRLSCRLLLRSLLLLGSALLAACQPTPPEQLLDYHQRVANVLELDAHWIEPEPLPAPPSRKLLQLPETDLRISLLDFLRLWQCDLNHVLGQRNSPMGKQAPPSQRLHVSRDILLYGPRCVEQLRAERPELAAELQALLQRKHDERQQLWWNAWLGSQEWQHLTRGSAQPFAFDTDTSAGMAALDYAIAQGHQWQRGEFAYDSDQMELQQQQLALSELVGRWRKSQALLTAVSLASADLLRQRVQQRPLCPSRKKTPRADMLHNVFRTFYAGRFQPYLSQTHRTGESLLGKLTQLQGLAPAPAVYAAWLHQLAQEKAALDAAHHQHVQAWQELLSSCDLMPKVPS